jgi:O-Antigen ligase
MREHLVAFVYILVIAGACFLVMAKPLTARAMTAQDFSRRRNLWFAVTAITFLAHDYWLALLATALLLAITSRREHNPVALYCAMLLVVPQFQMAIPGLGIVNQLFEIDHNRMLALVILLPAALRLAIGPTAAHPKLRVMDTMVAVYLVYIFAANATAGSLTGMMRFTVYMLLDYALLYYVVTRSITDRARLIDVMASFAMGVSVIGVIGGFETMRSWLVYESLRIPLGVPPQDIGTYLLRATEDGGYLRAYATAGHAIALGLVSAVIVTWQLALARTYTPKVLGVALVLMPVVGLLASVSRGPWLACAIAVVLGLCFGAGAKRRLAWMAALLPVIITVLLLLPQGRKFIDLLPFVGSVEPGSVTYRTQLIDQAMIVFWQNPVFGALNYIDNPALEVMRQGQGIIDIVNVYVGVALPYGAIGLLLFAAPSAYALISAWLTSRRLARSDPDGEAAGRALAVSLLAVLLVLGAASYYLHVPIIHWLTVSLCAAYAAHAPGWRKAPGAMPAAAAPGRARAAQRAPSRRHA